MGPRFSARQHQLKISAMKLSNLQFAVPFCLALSMLPTNASARGLFGSGSPAPAASAKAAPAPTAKVVPTPAPALAEIGDLESAIAQAQAARAAGNLAGANRILSQLVLFAPDDPRVLGEYGKTLTAQAKSDDALAFLERAIQLQPGEWSLYSAQGVAYDQKRNYKEAQVAYGRALSLKPGEPAVLGGPLAVLIGPEGGFDDAEPRAHADGREISGRRARGRVQPAIDLQP